MDIDKILFDKINKGKVNRSFEEMDIDSNGKIDETDLSKAGSNEIKDSIQIVLDSVDEATGILSEESTPTTHSIRQNSKFGGIPLTDANTFENDVLKSSGTVFVYIGNQNNLSGSFTACEKKAAENLGYIQQYANVYHLDTTNSDLVEKLRSQAGVNSMYSNCILKFVDGEFVETIDQSTAYNIDQLVSKAVGTPSKMPDILEPEDQNPNAPRNQYGVKTTNTENFENDVLNSKGTVYVTIGNLNTCGKCIELQKAIQDNAQTINAIATIYDLSTETDRDLCWQIYRDMGGGDGSQAMPLPQIAKFVDGKFVQLIPTGVLSSSVSNMMRLAEGTAKKDKDGIAQTSASTFNEDIKNSKGTVYVMITSADGCQYCNYLHNQMKNLMSEVQDKFGFYELATNQGADRDLCWQIYRDMGGGDGSRAMPLPQIAKFVDGEFVELLTNNRDFGTAGYDNATIKEMLEKAEGEPVNNSIKSMSSSISASEVPDDNTDCSTEKDNDDTNTLNSNLSQIQEELNKIILQKNIKEKELTKQESRLNEIEEEIREIEEEIKNADENKDISSLKSNLSSLKKEVNSLNSDIMILQYEIASLSNVQRIKSDEISNQNS